MPITDQIRSLARKEYAVLRSCITVVDRTIVTPFAGERAGAVLNRTRDTLDQYAQLLLGREHGAQHGSSADSSRSSGSAEKAAPAPTDAAPAADVSAPAGTDTSKASADPDEGSAVLSGGEVEEAEELAEEFLEAEDGHLTGELAENDELRRVQAELRAKHTIQEIDESGAR